MRQLVALEPNEKQIEIKSCYKYNNEAYLFSFLPSSFVDEFNLDL